MNAVTHPVSEALFIGQLFFGVIFGFVALVVYYRAYRQTRFVGLVWLIISSGLSLLTAIVWSLFGHYRPYPSIYVALVIGYRAMYLVDGVVGIIGVVLLVREFVRLYHAQKT
jgi:hypothetical protein